MKGTTALLPFALALPAAGLAQAPDRAVHALASPDGRVQVEVHLPAAATDVPTWSATFRGKPLLRDCRLGLVPAGEGDLLAGVRATGTRQRAFDERIPVLFGKADHADDRCIELRLSLQRPGGRAVEVVFRCYDDAIALRYELPQQDGFELLRLQHEGTSFTLAGDPVAYLQYLEHHTTSHEHRVTTVPYPDIAAGRLIDLPATFAWPDGTTAAITEAALRHYAGMSLWREAGAAALVCRLSPRPDGLEVVRAVPLRTPWRAVLLGDHPGALLESNTLYCLNDPPVFADTSWIRPGKMTWPWWNGYLCEAERGEPILSLATSKRYVDFCAAHGIAYHAVVADETDTPWYRQSRRGLFPGPDTDVCRPRDDLELPAIKSYAQQHGVGLWTWVHQAALRGRVDEAFAAFARLGWNGVMVDFFDRDDQDTVEFAEQILQAAAQHRVLLHFHGMFKPTGWQRTYPHLMNHEGALNLEYLKWSDACPPEHDLLVAFTRLVAGPMDYHLGGFRAVRRTDFAPRMIGPNVLGTRCHQLAMYVCFDNPNPMVADHPAAYRDQPGFEFLERVPTWWDETRVLQAEIGKWLLVARRRGQAWYLGGLGAGAPRAVALPLAFLGPGRHELRLWQDADDCAVDPNRLAVVTRAVAATDALEIRVAADGGFAAWLLPTAK